MFVTIGLAATLIAINFAVGSIIGLVVAAVVYRSRFGVALAFRAALFAGVAFLIASGIVGWAGSHAALQSCQRLDIAPWGEDLRLRNLIAENELSLCVVTSALAALLAGVRFPRTQHNNDTR